MAGSRDGASTIIKSVRTICRMVGLYGLNGITAATSPAYAAAVGTLVNACQAFEALDDYPYQIDETGGTGVEDTSPPAG